MRAKRERANQAVSVDLTPMIDVTFQLLIFFIVVTQISAQENVLLRLPGALAASEDDERHGLFTVHIAPVNQSRQQADPGAFGWFCYGDARPRSIDEMNAILLAEAAAVDPAKNQKGKGADGISENEMIVRCDARAPAGEFGRLIELMAGARLYKIRIAILKDREAD